jgi:tetratricopeptide (TPR) repeat protein
MPMMPSIFLRPAIAAALCSLCIAAAAPALASPTPSSGLSVYPSAPVPAPARAKLIEGLKAVQSGDLATAQKLFEEAAKLDPKDAEPLLGLADVAVFRRQPEAVEGYLKRAQTADPKSGRVPMAWGRYYLLRQDLPKAEEWMKKAVALDAKSFRIRVEYADFLLNAKRDAAGAEREFKAAAALEPQNAAVYYGLGNAQGSQQKFDEAIASFEQSAKLNASSPMPLHAIGRVHAARRDWDAAVKAFDRALEASADFVPALLDKGSALELKGDHKAALAQFEKAVSVAPRLAAAHLRLGTAYQRHRRLPEAEKSFAKALELAPDNLLALNNLAWISAERKNNLDQALEWAKKAVAMAPQAPNVNDTLGYVYLARKEPQKAIAPLKQASQAASGGKPIPSYVYRLGVAYAESGQKAEAIEQLQKALEVGTEFPEKQDAQTRLTQLQGK